MQAGLGESVPVLTVLAAILQTAILTAAYAIAHEAAHYAAATALGLRARPKLTRGPLGLPSPSIQVEEVEGAKRAIVLYSPYLINILLLATGTQPLQALALVTLPTALVEDDRIRHRGSTIAFAASIAAAIAVMGGSSMLPP